MRWLPKRHYANDRDAVFPGLPCLTRIHDILVQWAEAAGVGKHITFRTGRDTFTMMTLQAFMPIYHKKQKQNAAKSRNGMPQKTEVKYLKKQK